MPCYQGTGLGCPVALLAGFPSKVSVVVKRGHGRPTDGVPPRGDVGVRVLVWDTPGFGYHRFGGR